jgi:integral membrane protein (TIGR01906 family)
MTESSSPLTMRKRNIPTLIAQTYLAISMPFLIALVGIRLVMTPLFLQIEYTRPDFPEDYYGFTTEDRLTYAPYALNYLLNGDDLSYLGNLEFPDGKAMYNARELKHMRDVKTVTDTAYLAAVLGGLMAIIAGVYLGRKNASALRITLFRGGIFTIAIIVSIVVVALANWDYFFTGFHTLFFANGTWRFEYSDTLIRLFPEQFWFDASLTIGGITILTAVIIIALTWRRGKSA